MQALPISILSTANTPSPTAAAQPPFDPDSSSPFTAIFHAVLKGAGSNVKSALAGKAQDSSREPVSGTGTGNNLPGLSLQAAVVFTPAAILQVSPALFAPAPSQDVPVTAKSVATPVAAPNLVVSLLVTNSDASYSSNAAPAQSPADAPNSRSLSGNGMTDVAEGTAHAGTVAQGPAAASNLPLSQAATGVATNISANTALVQRSPVVAPNLHSLREPTDLGENADELVAVEQSAAPPSNPPASQAQAHFATNASPISAPGNDPSVGLNSGFLDAMTNLVMNRYQASVSPQGLAAMLNSLSLREATGIGTNRPPTIAASPGSAVPANSNAVNAMADPAMNANLASALAEGSASASNSDMNFLPSGATTFFSTNEPPTSASSLGAAVPANPRSLDATANVVSNAEQAEAASPGPFAATNSLAFGEMADIASNTQEAGAASQGQAASLNWSFLQVGTNLAIGAPASSAPAQRPSFATNSRSSNETTDLAESANRATVTAQSAAPDSNSLLAQTGTGFAENTVAATAQPQGPIVTAISHSSSENEISKLTDGADQASAPADGLAVAADSRSLHAMADLDEAANRAGDTGQTPPAALNSVSLQAATSSATNTQATGAPAQDPGALSNPLLYKMTNWQPVQPDRFSALSQDLISYPSIPSNDLGPRRTSIASSGFSQGPSPMQQKSPDATAALLPTTDSRVASNPENILAPAALEQEVPFASNSNWKLDPQASALPAVQAASTDSDSGNASPSQDNSAASSASSQNASVDGSNAPNRKPAPAIRANLSYLNLQTLASSPTPIAKTSAPVPQQQGTNQGARSNSQPQAALSSSLPETFASTAAKSATLGASALKFHDASGSSSANPETSTATWAAPAKTQTDDSSSGSLGSDSNSKPDHSSNATIARTDDKAVSQAIDAAAINPINGHAAVADPAAVAATVPAQAQITNSDAPPIAPNNADPKPAELLPDPAQNAPVVSAAHLIEQPGQTEIRIEMQADSLGGIELRAHIAGDQIGATIAVEHHDAQVALASDLPALHSALADKDLRVGTLSVSQGAFSSLSGGPGQDSGQRDFSQHPAKFAYLEQPEAVETFPESPGEWVGPANSSAGLSVVA